MRVLITGASGFIGKRLVHDLLERGHDVIALSRSGRADVTRRLINRNVEVVEDPGSAAELAERFTGFEIGATVHLAARFDGPSLLGEVDDVVASNVGFASRVAATMATTRPGSLFVNVATIWQHLDGHAYNPVSFYAATKQAFEDVLAYFLVTGQLDVRTLVLPDTYGPADNRGKVVSLLLEAVVTREPLRATSGHGVLDLVHVDDIVRGLVGALDPELGPGRWALTSGRTLSVRELASVVESVAGRPVAVAWGACSDRPRQATQLIVGAPPLPGWSPKVSLAEGLREMMNERRGPIDDARIWS